MTTSRAMKMVRHQPQQHSLDTLRARAALAKCERVDDAKVIRDQASAVKVFLKKRGAGIEQQNQAAEIILMAERKMGEILAELERRQGPRQHHGNLGNVAQISPYSIALEENGISRRDATRWQQLAAIPEKEFAGRVTTVRERMLQLTLFSILDKATKGKQAPSIQDRRTPLWLFAELSRLFGPFQLDAFATKENRLCERFLTRAQDGCAQDWVDATFGNPEFEDMGRPLEHAIAQAAAGVRSVILGPVGGSQDWYHSYAIQGTVYVPDCRINYDDPAGKPTNRADRDSVIIAFGREHANPDWQSGKFRVQRLAIKHLVPNA